MSNMPGISKLGQEKIWESAVQRARQVGREREYDYVMKLYKEMVGWKSMVDSDTNMSKSYLNPSQVSARLRDPGQVPNKENLRLMRDAKRPAKPITIARIMAHNEPRGTIESIVNDLGMNAAQRNDWISFLGTSINGAPNELVLRQDIMSKYRNEKVDGALGSAILQRSLAHWRGYRKSILHIVTPEDLLEKAEFHKYISRKRDKGGNWVYEYPEDKKNRIVSAILDWLTKPTNKLTVGSTARSFRIEPQFAGQVLRELENKGKINKVGDQYVGGGAKSNPVEPKNKQVDSNLWTRRSKFGVAGGPDEIVLSDFGMKRSAKVATGIPVEATDALEAIRSVKGIDSTFKIEHAFGAKIKIDPLIQTHIEGFHYLRSNKYVENVPNLDGYEMQYRLTLKAKESLKMIDTERELLLDRVKKTLPNLADMAHSESQNKVKPNPKQKSASSANERYVIPQSVARMVPGEQLSLFDKPIVPTQQILPVESASHAGEDVPEVVEHKQEAEHGANTQPEMVDTSDSITPKAKTESSPDPEKKKDNSKSRKVLAIEQGEHVWGSRADRFSLVNSSSDLAKLNPEEQQEYTTKKNLMPTVSANEHLDAGKSPEYILYRNAIESAVQSKSDNSQESRELYMDGITFIQRSMDAANDDQGLSDFLEDFHQLTRGKKRGDTKTQEEIEKMVDSQLIAEGKRPKFDWETRIRLKREYENVVDEYNSEVRKVPQDRDKILALRGRASIARSAYQDARVHDAYGLISRSLGQVGRGVTLAYKDNGNVTIYLNDESSEGLFKNKYYRMAKALGPRFLKLIEKPYPETNGPKAYKDAYKLANTWKRGKLSEDDKAKALLDMLGEKRQSDKPKTRKFKWEREVPGEIRRTGGEPVESADPSSLAKEFGFTNVQFGNWVTESDAESHIKGAHGALKDLSDIMGIDRKTISLNGRLSLAFGARGAGKASAHYEPSKKIINLTKMAGGGSLAHEWAHAMDNIMTLAHNPGSTKAGAMVSEGDDNGIHPGVASAFKEVVSAMMYKSNDEVVKTYNGFLERERSGENLSSGARRTMKIYQKMAEGSRSDFYNSSLAIGRGNKNSYWVRTHEMFARAFESFIEDELHSMGRESSYLVTGTRGGKSSPYPFGEDRKRINSAMNRLLDAIRQNKTLEKSLQRMYIMESI